MNAVAQEFAGERPELALFAARLREIVGPTPVARFARECGITESTFRGYCEGRTEPGLMNLQRIARYKNLTLDELVRAPSGALDAEGRYAMARPVVAFAVDEAANEALVAIPMLEGMVSAGPGSMVEIDPAFDVLYYRRDWVRREISTSMEALRLARVKGRSMEPLLQDRDRVFIDTSNRVPRPGRVYVFRQDGDYRIKRIAEVSDEGVLVTSDNREAYPPEMLPARAIEAGEIEFCGLAGWGERGFRLW